MIGRGRGGRIINIASISGLIANRGIGGRSYETAKAAVIAVHAGGRRRLGAAPDHGERHRARRVHDRPEPPLDQSVNPAIIETFKAQIPMGEFGEPEDLGPLAIYLASDASRYMTGAVLVIDGGYTLW